MSRGLSSAAKALLYAPNCTEVVLVLLTVEHADLGAVIRLVNDRQSVTSGGDVYTPYPFAARPPADRDGPPRGTIAIDNVDRALVVALRTITTPATVTIEVIRRSAPDTILASWSYLRMVASSIEASSITIELSADEVLDENYPGLTFTPLSFPAGFQR